MTQIKPKLLTDNSYNFPNSRSSCARPDSCIRPNNQNTECFDTAKGSNSNRSHTHTTRQYGIHQLLAQLMRNAHNRCIRKHLQLHVIVRALSISIHLICSVFIRVHFCVTFTCAASKTARFFVLCFFKKKKTNINLLPSM